MLKLKNVTKDYVSGELVVNALKGVDIKFRKSEFVAILGPSGCGKTTLLNIMGGLDQYTTGDLEINGISTVDYKDRDWDNYRNNSVGFVFQSYNLIMHQSVLANVELALTLSGVKKAERKERAKEALIKVGLEKEIHKMPNQLSGGQMQRVAIARAIVNNPHIILADEPTGALDTETSIQVMEILKEISKDRLVVMVTHNPELAEKYANRIISMSDGLILNDTNPISAQEEEQLEVKNSSSLKEEESDLTCEQSGKKAKSKKQKKAKMSIWTAFSLSLKNLFTKKARTILTSVAGSIGIIGIALILSVSSGFQSYIDMVESSTLSSQAITLRTESLDITNTLTSLMAGASSSNKEKRPNKDEIYPNPVTENLVSDISSAFSSTDLTGFDYYMQNNLDNSKIHGFRYNYGVNPIRLYGQNNFIRDYDNSYELGSDDYKLLYPYDQTRLNKPNWPLSFNGITAESALTSMFNNFNPFSTPLLKYNDSGELQDNWDLVVEQYDVLKTFNGYNINSGLTENQMLLVVDEYNQIPDSVLFSLGLRGEDALLYSMLCGLVENGAYDYYLDMKLNEVFAKTPEGDIDEGKFNSFKTKYAQIQERKGSLRWSEYFTGSEQGKADEAIMIEACIYLFFGYTYNKARNEAPITFADIESLNAKGNNKNGYKIIASVDEVYQDGSIVKKYTHEQINQVLKTASNEIVTDIEIVGIVRLKSGATYGSLSTGLVYSNKLLEKLIAKTDSSLYTEDLIQYTEDAFKEGGVLFDKYKEAFGTPVIDENKNIVGYTLTKEQVKGGVQAVSYKDLLDNNGDPVATNRRVVTEISLYASSFENKDYLIEFINDFNTKVEKEESGVYGEKVEYSDLMGDLFKSVDIILNAITYVLVAFVGISLIVSSIMIGIITYISVLERTKEIGVLRSIGASKKDVGRVFNAETVIIGGVSGLFGVVFSALLTIPIRIILKTLTGVAIPVALPFTAAFILVMVSIGLTLIAGLIPSRMASKKDPVVALRSE